MPPKYTKSGKRICSFLLPNGNLVVHTNNGWVEVAPGDSLYKRWIGVAVEEADPRDAA